MNYFTLHNYYQNPLGKGATVISVKAQRERYENEYPSLESKISVIWYRSKYSLIAHILFPSKSVDLHYDVIMEFDMRNINSSVKVINDIPCRVFSNCPSFVFTYANVFNHKDILCPWLRGKYDKGIFKKMPKIRNPYQLVSFERSLYLSTMWILKEGRNRIERIESSAVKITTMAEVASKIKTQKEILEKYQKLKKIDRKNDQEEKRKLQNSVATQSRPKNVREKLLDTHTKPKNTIKSVKSVKKTSKVSKSSKVHKTKKV